MPYYFGLVSLMCLHVGEIEETVACMCPRKTNERTVLLRTYLAHMTFRVSGERATTAPQTRASTNYGKNYKYLNLDNIFV